MSYADEMPDSNKLCESLKKRVDQKKQELLRDVSRDSPQIQGIVEVKQSRVKFESRRAGSVADQVHAYAKNFSSIADLADVSSHKPEASSDQPAMLVFANVLKD